MGSLTLPRAVFPLCLCAQQTAPCFLSPHSDLPNPGWVRADVLSRAGAWESLIVGTPCEDTPNFKWVTLGVSLPFQPLVWEVLSQVRWACFALAFPFGIGVPRPPTESVLLLIDEAPFRWLKIYWVTSSKRGPRWENTRKVYFSN